MAQGGAHQAVLNPVDGVDLFHIVDHSYARCERHLQPGDLDNRQLQLSFSRKIPA